MKEHEQITPHLDGGEIKERHEYLSPEGPGHVDIRYKLENGKIYKKISNVGPAQMVVPSDWQELKEPDDEEIEYEEITKEKKVKTVSHKHPYRKIFAGTHEFKKGKGLVAKEV